MENQSTASLGAVRWWKRRSQLEKTLLIALIITALVLLAVLLYVIIKPFTTRTPCSTTSCLLAASEIATHMDPSVNPCNDFFKFVCGKLIRKPHPYKNLESTASAKLNEQVQWHISEIIQEPVSDDDHYMVKNQKKLFQACMDETAQEQESVRIIEEAFTELNGWPVVVGKTWNEKLFFWSDMVVKLKRRGYHYKGFLTIDSIEDTMNPYQYILHIDAPRVPRDEKQEHVELYKRYMVDVAVAFGAEQRIALEDMDQVIEFRNQLKEMGSKHIRNVYINETESTRYTIREFQEHNNEINWLDFINAVLYPVKKISSDDYVIFPTSDFLGDFLNLLRGTPKRTQANYIMWTAIERLIPFLSKQLKKIRTHYDCLTDLPLHEDDRFKLCKSLLFHNFLPVPSLITYARRYLPDDKRREVEKLYKNIKLEFLSLVKETSWMDEESKKRALEKANLVTEAIAMQEDYFKEAVYEQGDHNHYFQRRSQSTSFLNIYLNVRKNYEDTWLSKIHIQNDTTRIDLYGAALMLLVEPFHVLHSNVLIFPVGLLEKVYHCDRPMYLNYGATGFLMGSEIAKAFSGKGSELGKDVDSYNIWTEQSENAYEEKTKCFLRDIDNFMRNKEINATSALDQLIADTTGMKVAYDLYIDWVDENREEPPLVGMSYTPQQLFWIAAMSYQCFKLKDADLVDIPERQILNAYHTAAPMRHNYNFAKDFNCPINSKMNPEEKCQVF